MKEGNGDVCLVKRERLKRITSETGKKKCMNCYTNMFYAIFCMIIMK